MSLEHIPLSAALHEKLQKFCESKGFMRGDEYYKVPDFNFAVSFLIDEYRAKQKQGRGNKRNRRRTPGKESLCST